VKTMDEVLAIALVQPLVRRDAARASDVEAHAPALYEATH